MIWSLPNTILSTYVFIVHKQEPDTFFDRKYLSNSLHNYIYTTKYHKSSYILLAGQNSFNETINISNG